MRQMSPSAYCHSTEDPFLNALLALKITKHNHSVRIWFWIKLVTQAFMQNCNLFAVYVSFVFVLSHS